MPRAFDLRQQQMDKSPLANLLDFQDIDATVKLAGNMIKGYVDSLLDGTVQMIKDLTGLDLSELADVLQGLDISSPEAFLQSLVNAIAALPEVLASVIEQSLALLTSPEGIEPLTDLLAALVSVLVSVPGMLVELGQALINSGARLLGPDSPINLLNAFNLISPSLLGQIDISHIGSTLTNLLTDPHFLDDTLADIEGWVHDLTGGFGGFGAMFTTADGTLKELFGNLIAVSQDQELPISVKAKWTGLAGSGTPIALGVTGYAADGSAIDQQTVAQHNTTPVTTDWLTLSGVYPVPAGVTSVRTRLIVSPAATAGQVGFSDVSATKRGAMLQRLIRGTNAGEFLPDDIGHLFSGVVTNALSLLEKASQGEFSELLSTIGGPYGDDIEAAGQRLEEFLHSLSPLNGSNITSGNVADQFVSGIGTLHDNIVTAVGNLGGNGFDIGKVFEVLAGQTHALVDHGSGISQMYARMTNLESQFAALPVSAGGVGAGKAEGGLVGATDTDLFERVSSSNLGPLWLPYYVGGAGTWATPNGHDATFNTSGNSTREFLMIRNNSAIPRSQTDYQRVTMELSSKATRDRDFLGLYDFCGTNDVWLRISDATTSLANVTGYRIRWEGDGALSITRYISGAPSVLASLGTGGIVPPGPGAQLIGEAGVLADGARLFIRAKIGESVRLGVNDAGATNYGATFRRWGHGGRAQGASLFVGQTKPGGVHFWAGQDQTL